MLIRKPILERLRRGEVTLAFRRWRRPTVKAGGYLRTAVGVLTIQAVEVIDPADISEADAQKAGHATRAALLEELADRVGDCYRIQLAYAGEDPRLALRETVELSIAERKALRDRLAALDRRSKVGPWTERVLEAIAEHPRRPAVELAEFTGLEKNWLKTHIRQLKELGLTLSHQPGYELSPRGKRLADLRLT